MDSTEKLNSPGKPFVSILLITYNHEHYIRQAVDSILQQQMDFAYELIIADDASTDRTQEILKETYSKAENVRLILREKNSEGANAYLAMLEARGQYVYLCEGDDYWIGSDGLQTLVDWLRCHEKYVGVCGRRVTLSEKTGFMSVSYDIKTNNSEIALDDFLKTTKIFDVCAILYKNFYMDGKYDYRTYVVCQTVGDVTMVLYILLHGKVFQLDKVVGVYRSDRLANVGSYNVTHTPKMMFEDHIQLLANLNPFLGEKMDFSDLKRRYTSGYVGSLPSLYEFIRQMPYICKQVGIKITMEFLKKRIDDLKNKEKQ